MGEVVPVVVGGLAFVGIVVFVSWVAVLTLLTVLRDAMRGQGRHSLPRGR